MKSSRVELYTWHPALNENIEIDWPKVHKTIGLDQTRWLLAQPTSCCQIMLDRSGACCRLMAEFYTEQALLNYQLMWAK